MTKKYWNDWQKRIGETKNIYLFWKHPDGWQRKRSYGELNAFAGDKIIKAYFHGDAVDLAIEKWHHTFSKSIHVYNDYITLHREEIASIEFKE